MTIKTAHIRLVCDTREEAEGAIAALIAAVGHARVAIPAPRQGRDKLGDGNPPWLAYGTFQFELEDAAEPPPAAPPTTGPTTRLAETGPTRQLRRGGA